MLLNGMGLGLGPGGGGAIGIGTRGKPQASVTPPSPVKKLTRAQRLKLALPTSGVRAGATLKPTSPRVKAAIEKAEARALLADRFRQAGKGLAKKRGKQYTSQQIIKEVDAGEAADIKRIATERAKIIEAQDAIERKADIEAQIAATRSKAAVEKAAADARTEILERWVATNIARAAQGLAPLPKPSKTEISVSAGGGAGGASPVAELKARLGALDIGKYLPWILGGGAALVVIYLLMRRRGGARFKSG